MGGCGYFHCCTGRVFRSPSKNKVNRDAKTVVDVGVSHRGKAENGENLLQQSISKDPDGEINRSSRVSSQFLPPEGSKTVEVPSENFELRYSYLSQRGYYPDSPDKANQDSFCIVPSFASNPNCHFFGVFDGHGEFGAQCSEFVKNNLSENLLKSSKFHVDPAEACHSAFLTTNMQLHLDDVDDSMSGTTAITVLVQGRTLVVANAGDSRAIIAEKRGEDLVAIDLSIDQTPFRRDELERVKLSGARVLTLDQIEGLKNPDVQCWGTEEGDDGDPPRLWVQNGMYPGTAFTRSIGDSIAESIGVVSNPEIAILELTSDHPFFIIASDGVFEFLSSQTVVDMVSKFKDPHDACAAIVAESYRLWLQYETRTDDITIIIVHINGLTNASSDHVKPLNHVKELTGSESPSTLFWNSRNHPARHDPSRSRVRAIEWSLGNGQTWVPPNLSHRKTWEEEAHIERALQEHFLFRKLTDTQCHVLIDCMQKVDHRAGDIVVHQGEEGDCFYIVGSGEFEVLSSQDEENGEKDTIKVFHRYTADKLSCFGELALMYNKPPQASVRAVTDGILWALKREDFRGILMSEFSNLPSLKLLRSVDILSKLSILQLSHIAGSLLELSFSDGQTIVNQDECVTSLYIIQKGQVRLTYKSDVIRRGNSSSLSSSKPQNEFQPQSNNEHSVIKGERSYFGEWSLLGEHVESFTAVSVGDVICLVLPKDKFDVAVGSLIKLVHDEYRLKNIPQEFSEETSGTITTTLPNVQFSDMEWTTGICATDCSEIGLVFLKGSEKMLTLKRFSKWRIKRFGKQAQVMREKEILTSLGSSTCVPQVLCTCQDDTHLGILLNTCVACPLASILPIPLDEPSARFFAASIVIALEALHKNNVICRGVSPDNLMLDRTGHLQIVDFRFGKRLSSGRTFTICGMADSLAPEIVLGKGHGFPADWWALGVLIYFMLQAEPPFGSWRESESDTFARIAKGQMTLPQTFSLEAVDLISKLLDVDENSRLGSQGPDSVKCHKWFNGINWNQIADCTFIVPHEIISRINTHLENHSDDCSFSVSPNDKAQFDDLSWFEDW